MKRAAWVLGYAVWVVFWCWIGVQVEHCTRVEAKSIQGELQ